MTAEDEEHFQNTNICHICDGEIYDDDDDDKVRDHDHLTGKYRRPAHNQCNLHYKNPNFILVFIHNLTGYDAHLFVKELGYDEQKIDLIPNNEERYISFSKKIGKIKLRFIDSFKFMASSIDKLSSNLKKKQFRETSKFFRNHLLDLVIRKGVYPYDYMDSWEKCEMDKLPPKQEFYSTLNEWDITDKDYKHAKHVWESFKIRNMGEFSDLYVKTDVLILADIFENFRNVCMKTYKLDPAWYFPAPGLSWDAMLKKTEVKLDLIADYDMILMLEKRIRGGISQCCNRYGKANNKC
ncbi:uncharacterized protein LOC111615072 [Centruroides sculpturatus]|uniref:uncharacterized protein LOC111615072 n=1 Tax=Centruroides sculpturatus TaxID=218467 RepID=UPI000C6CEBA3|nr:uncharacterized protein LOC111615072 [Centruroides sculpturatus]